MRVRAASFLPFVIAGIIIAAAAGGSYYAIVFSATATSTRITWTANPLSITFSATGGSGSKPDSLTCAASFGPLQLLAKSSNPSVLILSVSPSSFASCGSSPDNVVVTASCAAGVSAAACRGTYQGQIQVRAPTAYNNVPDVLKVLVSVT